MRKLRVHILNYIICVVGWVLADSIFVLVRFVGLSTVPAFKTLDYASLNHALLFSKSFIIGILAGTVFYFVNFFLERPSIRRRPYGLMILIHVVSIVVCVAILLLTLRVHELAMLGRELTIEDLSHRLVTVNFLVVLTYYTMVTFIFVMVVQISRKFGPGNLGRMVMGTFYHPGESEKVFMFLDLRNSTAHAERLGHLKFGALIQDCFFDLSVVDDYDASIYQYVGDEAVLYWNVDRGIDNANCLRAYFAFRRRLLERVDYYEREYGIFPEFKAGLHIGYAIVLEVGEVKREIAYLGDVLNTTSRIMEQCNIQRQSLLISDALRVRLGVLPETLEILSSGRTEIRGRKEPIGLWCVRERQPLSLRPVYSGE